MTEVDEFYKTHRTDGNCHCEKCDPEMAALVRALPGEDATLEPIEFRPWPKLARLNRDIVVTEKIDGTNAAVGVMEDGRVYAQSRSKIITPTAISGDKSSDNHGFAQWVWENDVALRDGLGVGIHFGEWWGPGINKRYTAYMDKGAGKTFSLFNTHRWHNPDGIDIATRPSMVDCVPVMYQGPFSQAAIDNCMEELRVHGSWVCPGAPSEGVVVYHTAARIMLKETLEHDEMSKGEAEKIAKAQA